MTSMRTMYFLSVSSQGPQQADWCRTDTQACKRDENLAKIEIKHASFVCLLACFSV